MISKINLPSFYYDLTQYKKDLKEKKSIKLYVDWYNNLLGEERKEVNSGRFSQILHNQVLKSSNFRKDWFRKLYNRNYWSWCA